MSSLFDLPFEDSEPDRGPATEAGPVEQDPPRATAASLRRVLSVSELSSRIRSRLESDFMEIWVQGEISNCRLWNTGHLYFTLKDTGAQIKAVMFRSALRALR